MINDFEVGLANPSTVRRQDRMILAQKMRAEASKSRIPTPAEAAKEIRTLSSNYEQNIVVPVLESEFKPENLHRFTEWDKSTQRRYSRWRLGMQKRFIRWVGQSRLWSKGAESMKGKAATGEAFHTFIGDASHDANVVLNVLSGMVQLEDNQTKFFLRSLQPTVIRFPMHVMERVARNINGEVRRSPFDVIKSVCDAGRFFKEWYFDDSNIVIDVENETDAVAIVGDDEDALAAFFNPLRNSSRRDPGHMGLFTRVNNGKLIIEARDDAGGFSNELLGPYQTTDSHGAEIVTQAAFVRSIAKGNERGSGFGLDIVRRIVCDRWGGSVSAFNENYPGTSKLGAVVRMEVPVGP